MQEHHAQARDLLDAMFLTMRRLRREGAPASNMSYAEVMILGYLRKSPGRGVSDLAAEAGVSGPTMSGQIKRLEAAGMIVRQSGPDHDRRRVSLTLSPKAEGIIDSLKQQAGDWMAAQLSGLSPEDRLTLEKAVPVLMGIAGVPSCREDAAR